MRNIFLRSLLPALVLAALPMVSSAGVFIGVSVNVPPPPLPVYAQPYCPQPGFIWIPGYWAWGPYGYYWVPGTWVLPPEVGLLWTPGYWAWEDGIYLWHAGYWGPRVGFYGGIDYGYGYDGFGFVGGYWRGGIFFYNRAVVRVGPDFARNVYYRRPDERGRPDFRHVSFNGGPRGVIAGPSRMDLTAERERRFEFTSAQRQHERLARNDRALRADFNHGRPPVAATARPTAFHGQGVIPARSAGGPMPPRGRTPIHPDRPPWVSGQGRSQPQSWQGAQAPQRLAPQYRGSQYRQPQHQPPRYPQPQYQQPQYRQPQYPRPQYQQPQYRQPQYQRPQYQQPQYRQPPQYQQPQYRQPSSYGRSMPHPQPSPRAGEQPNGGHGHGGWH